MFWLKDFSKKKHYYREIFYDFSTYKGINSKTQPHFPENTASAKFALEGLQILILGDGKEKP